MRAVIVALTDLGRSPRMQYHAHALAANGVDVDLVGYEGTPIPRRIAEATRITIHRLKVSTLRVRQGSGVRYAILAMVDAARLSWRLWRILRNSKAPSSCSFRILLNFRRSR
jgi:hypothetical protein